MRVSALVNVDMTENETIALFHPGEMGAAVGACLVGRGHRVLWASSGRSVASAARAEAAGLEDAVTFERALEQAQVVLSICPPHGATALARKVAEARFHGVFVDCNAIAPETARAAMEIAEAAGARFVDGGIVGPPPTERGRSRLFLCGGASPQIATLFAGTNMEAVLLDAPAGAASALKACYAAWTKGTTALLAAIRALARQEGVEAALLDEWKRSHPKRRIFWYTRSGYSGTPGSAAYEVSNFPGDETTDWTRSSPCSMRRPSWTCTTG